jgi:hypothetical protein
MKMIKGSTKIKYTLYGQKIENLWRLKMKHNEDIVKTAIEVIQKFRKVMKDDEGIIAINATKFWNGNRDSAADDIVNDIHQCTDLVLDYLYDETMRFMQALLNAEVGGYFVQGNGVYKTREEYADAHIKAVKDYYGKLDDTMHNFIEEVNAEMKKGTDKTDA